MSGWSQAKRILCVRLDNMGDVLMTTPALRALKRFNPDARLTLLTSNMGAGIVSHIPEVDDVIEFDVPWARLKQVADADSILSLVARLHSERFDAAILFTVFSQNPLPAALICYLAGIPLRLGYCRENPHDLLTDWLPDTEPFTPIQHEVERQLALVGSIGASLSEPPLLSLRSTPEMSEAALAKAGINSAQPWLILHPGVSEPKRQYPPDGYIAAGKQLSQAGFQIVVTGAASEKLLAERVATAVGGQSLAGALSLDEYIGLVDAAPVLISNNTGPVHIAAALNTPVVVLYALTNPQHLPWAVPYRALYFDVPSMLRSKSPLLVQVYQQMKRGHVQDAQPEEIVSAVYELIGQPITR
jgi:lipopolysaccharide heptosyltransferase II